ncbi:hypothetical protein IW152_005558 [Coemansia sp. BCRC 34962]|nr:hypothetical protein IW152_005558 [Coemansia sp. BCRC 34962]
MENTPDRGARFDEYSLREELERAEYRRKLVEELHRRGVGEKMQFPTLMGMLGLDKKYHTYKSNTSSVFDQLAMDIPTVSSVVAVGGCRGRRAEFLEKRYIEGLKRVLDMLSKSPPHGLPQAHSKNLYMYTDCQNEPLEPTKVMPDLVFSPRPKFASDMYDVHIILEGKQAMARASAYNNHLGQLADYALELKKLQPMRKFVPILFLFGRQLDLVTFVHDRYYRTEIGTILYVNEDDRDGFEDIVSNSLRDLWFILTLPVHEFGHFVDNLVMPKYAQLDVAARPALLVPMDVKRRSNFEVHRRIDRKVYITGRRTYLFHASYEGNNAIFKMTWLPKSRLPEGAVHRVLGDASVPNTPTVYASGVLVDDFCGYRLEYLVMEHCGTPIVDYLQAIRSDWDSAADVADAVTMCVQSVAQALVAAFRSNVLHRDISAGNIAVKGGRVYVIDWGCAKLTEKPSDEQAADMVSRWGFDSSNVVQKESEKDPFTGTPLYMSIQMLFNVRRRGVVNDIESLFYVVMDSLSEHARGKDSKGALGFVLHSEPSLAMMRIGILGDDQRYLENFGVKSIGSAALRDIVDSMRKFLFFEGEAYIGGQLQNIYDRKMDLGVAKRFMNSETLSLLDAFQQTTHSSSSTPIEAAAPNLRTMVARSQRSPPAWQLPLPAVTASFEGDFEQVNLSDSSGKSAKPSRKRRKGPLANGGDDNDRPAVLPANPPKLVARIAGKLNRSTSAGRAGASKPSAASGSTGKENTKKPKGKKLRK